MIDDDGLDGGIEGVGGLDSGLDVVGGGLNGDGGLDRLWGINPAGGKRFR